jgi:dipeptidyl aminopeptidase/acylaminoacyl peptidase
VLGDAPENALHRYGNSGPEQPFNPALYTSTGYAVLFVQVQNVVNNPGPSALRAVSSALNAAAAAGIADSTRLGIYGRAMGGFQASYIITQSGMFAAAAASSPITSLVNMGASAVPTDGNSSAALRRAVQRLFSGSFADSSAPYVRNSPVYNAAGASTPLLLMHNPDDELVDVRQSLDFYSALRQLGKPALLLQYPEEGHTLLRPENQADAATRLFSFFEHHLRGGVAPAWLSGGTGRQAPLLPPLQ